MTIYQMKKNQEKKTKIHKHSVSAEQILFTGLITNLQDLKIKFVSENKHQNLKQ